MARVGLEGEERGKLDDEVKIGLWSWCDCLV